MDASLDAARVMQMRREAYSKSEVTCDDLSNLLAAGRAAGAAAPPEYADLLSQVAVDLLVNQVDPPKYINQPSADWFVDQLVAGGLGCAAEYEMLVDVIRDAVRVPANLADFAVSEVEKAIVKGHAAASGASDHAAGVVTADDIAALRAAVFAATTDSSLHVTRASAEALFRIAHATAGAANDPGFEPFFAGAVGNHLMGISHHWTPSAEEEVAEEKALAEKPTFGRFLGGLMHQGPADSEAKLSVDEITARQYGRENAADEAELAQAAAIDPSETDWLLGQLTRGGRLAPAETALLRFLKQESPELSSSLLAAAGAAAAA